KLKYRLVSSVTALDPAKLAHSENDWKGRAPWKGGVSQWVKDPPGNICFSRKQSSIFRYIGQKAAVQVIILNVRSILKPDISLLLTNSRISLRSH
ncbi:hypothetical protein N9H39_11405, partial [Gammaproteobacteria bacterium]|nr:hypothetical protein [Gammaproteobacteria bacterium]